MSVEAAVDHLPDHVPVDTESAAFVSLCIYYFFMPHLVNHEHNCFPQFRRAVAGHLVRIAPILNPLEMKSGTAD